MSRKGKCNMPDNFIDFKLVKQQVSMFIVLDHYSIRLRQSNKTELRGKCPLPTHTSKSSTESFGVQIEKNIWACQSQSCAASRGGKRGGNVLDFVAVMENCTIRQAAEKLSQWFAVSPAAPFRSATSTPEKSSSTGQLVAEKRSDREATGDSNKPLSFTLKDIDPTHPYITGRGITEKTAHEFGVGYFPGRGMMQGRVVIPIQNEFGELVAYAGRSIDNTEPKYKMPAGFRKSVELFNLLRAVATGNATTIIVEGFFDCMHVHQAGFPCVALMGSSMSNEQTALLCKYFTGALLMLDGDAAGREATEKLLVELGSRIWVKAVLLPDGVQPDNLSADELADQINQ